MAAAVPVVFIHGIGGSARVWAGQLDAFAAAGYAPVAHDLPGYGGRPLLDATTFDALAGDIEAAVAAGGLDAPVLVGHSMGGMIAQTALRRRPGAYRAAVLCCTSPAFGNAEGDFQKRFVADRLRPLDAGRTMADLAQQMVPRMMGATPHQGARACAIEAMSAVPATTYRAAISCLVNFDERANLARIGVPVLCLAGESDPNAPAAVMLRMAGKIPGARYVCLPEVGHLPNLEAPAVFDAAILDFLRQALAPAPDRQSPQ